MHGRNPATQKRFYAASFPVKVFKRGKPGNLGKSLGLLWSVTDSSPQIGSNDLFTTEITPDLKELRKTWD